MIKILSILPIALCLVGCKTQDIPVPDASAAYWGQVKAYATMIESPKAVANHLLTVAAEGAKADVKLAESARNWEKLYDKEYNRIGNQIQRFGWWSLVVVGGGFLVVNLVGGLAGGLGAGGILGSIGRFVLNGGGIFGLGKWVARQINPGSKIRWSDRRRE
jgi:predicted component of type VI protein secretion system